MKLKFAHLFIILIISAIGFLLFNNAYSICQSNNLYCSNFLMHFLYPTMYFTGLSFSVCLAAIMSCGLDTKNFIKYLTAVYIALIIISLNIPTYCNAPLGFCFDRKPFILFYSCFVAVIVLAVSAIFFIKNKLKTRKR